MPIAANDSPIAMMMINPWRSAKCSDGDQHDSGDLPGLRVEGIREPYAACPRPPENRQHDQPATEPSPGCLLRHQGRHLREREDEHEVEEELERRDPMLRLD